MRLSKYIQELQEVFSKHGDLQCFYEEKGDPSGVVDYCLLANCLGVMYYKGDGLNILMSEDDLYNKADIDNDQYYGEIFSPILVIN